MLKKAVIAIATVVFGIYTALWALTWFVKPYVIPSGFMEDTLLAGDRMFVTRTPGEIRRGDILWFQLPTDKRQLFVKRVVGLPGDRVKLVDKRVYLNGTPLDEPYACHKTSYVDSYRDNFPAAAPNARLPEPVNEMLAKNVVNHELLVPANSYFVLGDNRDNSLDSRYWGCVPAANFTGKALIIYYSRDASGKTRWKRTFHRVG